MQSHRIHSEKKEKRQHESQQQEWNENKQRT